MSRSRMLRLVHGTSAAHLDSIVNHGIRPRGKAPCRWECESNPRMVYLSEVYALYYAMQACPDDADEPRQDALLVEVEVPQATLYPDEDFIAHCMDEDFKKMYPALVPRTMACRAVIDNMRPEVRRHYTRLCLAHLGNAAYCGTVHPARITRIARIPHADFAKIILTRYDPCPIPLNFQIMGADHKATQAAILDEYNACVV